MTGVNIETIARGGSETTVTYWTMAYGDCIERLISLLSLKMVDECMWAAIQAEAPDTGSIQLTESHPRQTVDMSRLVTDLMVAGQLALRTLGRRMRVELESPPDLQSFRREMDAVLVNAPATLVREYRWVHLPADRPPCSTQVWSLRRGKS